MSRSQRTRSKKSSNPARIAQTQPNPEISFDLNEHNDENDERFLDSDQKQDLIKKIVIYLLQNATIKTPIKRVDIIKHVLNGQSAIFNEVFKLAKTNLSKIYGLNVVETSKPNTYICIQKFPTKSITLVSPEGQKRFSLLFMIVSYVFMKGGKITHTNLREYLNAFDIQIDQEHTTFGNVKKLIEDFIKQMYLKKTITKVESLAEDVVEYSWGERSELEFDKKILLGKVASLLNKPVECFMEQYGKAYENGIDDDSMDVSQETDSDD